MLWTKTVGDFQTEQNYLYENTVDSEMNVISAGWTKKSIAATNVGGYDWLFMKHDPSGELIWQKQLWFYCV